MTDTLSEMLEKVENRPEKQLVKRAAVSDEFTDIRMSRQMGEIVITTLVLEDGFYVLTQTPNYNIVERVEGPHRDYIKDELEELLDKKAEAYTYTEEARSE